jgi:hypothetical protein
MKEIIIWIDEDTITKEEIDQEVETYE